MAYKHENVTRAQHELLTSQRAQQLARYEAARQVEDDAETMDAADQILQADHKLAALNRITNNHVAGQQQQTGQQRNRFGLTPEEQEIARMLPNRHKDYPREPFLTHDQKEQIYARKSRQTEDYARERHLFGQAVTMVEFTRPGNKIDITETDEHGRTRLATATNRSGHGGKYEAIRGLQDMLANTENQFVRDAARGDRSPQNVRTGPRDRYVSLPDALVFKTGR
jgi:hypothetical protein